jgi:hypothetical protein
MVIPASSMFIFGSPSVWNQPNEILAERRHRSRGRAGRAVSSQGEGPRKFRSRPAQTDRPKSREGLLDAVGDQEGL